MKGGFRGLRGRSGRSGAYGWLRLVSLYSIAASRAPGVYFEARSRGVSFFRLTYSFSPEWFSFFFSRFCLLVFVFRDLDLEIGFNPEKSVRRRRKRRVIERILRGF